MLKLTAEKKNLEMKLAAEADALAAKHLDFEQLRGQLEASKAKVEGLTLLAQEYEEFRATSQDSEAALANEVSDLKEQIECLTERESAGEAERLSLRDLKDQTVAQASYKIMLTKSRPVHSVKYNLIIAHMFPDCGFAGQLNTIAIFNPHGA